MEAKEKGYVSNQGQSHKRDRRAFTCHISVGETTETFTAELEFRCPLGLVSLKAVTSGLVNDKAAIVWWWKQQFNESVLIHMAAGLGHEIADSPHPKTGSAYY